MRGPIPDKPRERPTVLHVIPLIEAYYRKPGNEVGGNMHVVLDDYNLEDWCIAYCRDRSAELNDDDGVRLASLLLQMTGTQRRVASTRADKYGMRTTR